MLQPTFSEGPAHFFRMTNPLFQMDLHGFEGEIIVRFAHDYFPLKLSSLSKCKLYIVKSQTEKVTK
jgi:hypothetical protein